MRSRVPAFVAAMVLTACASSVSAGGGAKARARKILAETGTTGGLVVHVGYGDGRLTAALRAHDGLTVQGIADTQAQVDAARAYLLKAGLQGPVTVDRWDGKRLPYAEGLVNLLVCEDAARIDTDEADRVLAPGGVAYLKTS